MASQFGLTVDDALERLLAAERIKDDAERRREYWKILGDVRLLGYHDGSEEERFSHDY